MIHPTSTILLEFIKETFTFKGKNPSKLPINEFIKYYNKKLDQGWLNLIIGDLTPFVTFLSSSSFVYHTDNITISISFFESKLDSAIPSKYQQTKADLFAAVKNSFGNRTGGWDRHPLNAFLIK